jgi:hypothetical protein
LARGHADAAAFGNLDKNVERPEIEIEGITSGPFSGVKAPVAIHQVMNS